MARVLLISYPGYPSTPAQLVANPWLANLAASLLEAEHDTLALDFGTVSMMRRLCSLQSGDTIRNSGGG